MLVVAAMRRGGRLIYVGAGTSGRLGVLDAAECPPTFRTDPELVQGIIAGGQAAMFQAQEGAEDSAGGGAAAIDERAVGEADVVVGIAAGGTTPFVHGALRRAAERGAGTVFLSCVQPVENEPAVDVVIRPITGPEVVTGSTRLKAGTATKLVLNTISTLAMVQMGKVYENLMVDLRATNQKLAGPGDADCRHTHRPGPAQAARTARPGRRACEAGGRHARRRGRTLREERADTSANAEGRLRRGAGGQ